MTEAKLKPFNLDLALSPLKQNQRNAVMTQTTTKKDKFLSDDEGDSIYSPDNIKIKIRKKKQQCIIEPLKNTTNNKMYIKPWSIISDPAKSYYGSVSLQDHPQTPMDGLDYQKRLTFEQLKETKLKAMSQWKTKDTKGLMKAAYIKDVQNKNSQILKLAEKDQLEKLNVYTDRFPMLILRKSILRIICLIKMVAFTIISSKIFDNISIMVILANSVVMVFDDSSTNDDPNPIYAVLETVFLVLYSAEMFFKIVGMGFFFTQDAYLKDWWNILDFLIVMTSYLTLFQSSGSTNEASQEIGEESSDSQFSTSGLRVFRVLRPLKTISSIKGLRVLIEALMEALPLLRDTLMILLFFFIIFAIAGLQMFGGLLKQRCISVQTGMIHPNDLICGTTGAGCPGGYFCGKGSENPNYGVTNFDNLFYSFLTVFQCVTLEGWSDVQRQMQKAFVNWIWLFFVPLVLIGAFFLLNLTLAVINSKFTEAHKKQQEKDLQELRDLANKNEMNDEMEHLTNKKDSLTMIQYITARIYAKKMIRFLRLRQEDKLATKKQKDEIKAHQKAVQKVKRTPMQERSQTVMDYSKFDLNKDDIMVRSSSSLSLKGRVKENKKVQLEDVGEISEDNDEREKLDDEIRDFIKKGEMDIISQRTMMRPIIPASHMDFTRNSNYLDSLNPYLNMNLNTIDHKERLHTQQSIPRKEGAPRMKGNIGAVNKKALMNQSINNFSIQLAAELDIDNVIPNKEKDTMKELSDSQSFKISNAEYVLKSDSSIDDRRNFHNKTALNGHADEPSGLISSDSDFDQEVQKTLQDYPTMIVKNSTIQSNKINSGQITKKYLKADVTKTFKKMLTSNHNRNQARGAQGTGGSIQSTNEYESIIEFENQSQNLFEIESKFQKKQGGISTRKSYKDELVDSKMLQIIPPRETDEIPQSKKPNPEDFKIVQEAIDIQRPADQFKEIDPLTQKIDIAKDTHYKGTSQFDVLQQRQIKQEKTNRLKINQYIQLPKSMVEVVDPDFAPSDFVKSRFLSHQQKIEYQYKDDSSEIEESESDNEDRRQAEEQPFETPASIGYSRQLNQIQLQEHVKRSDIIISSTLSLSLIPKDTRIIKQQYRTQMTPEQLVHYLDEKNAFEAMLKEHQYQSNKYKHKELNFREMYSKSIFTRLQFKSKTLRNFKDGVKQLNSNIKPVVKKSLQVMEIEKLRHQQNCKASEKRGYPRFDLITANKLLAGKYHEIDEDDDQLAAPIYSQNRIEDKNQKQLLEFEAQARDIIFDLEDEKDIVIDEIPIEIRHEFSLPKKMDFYEVNFSEIRKNDASRKRNRPMWSGQDVLPDQFDEAKSKWILGYLNSHRVWPLGFEGLAKRVRSVIRMHVKSDTYDNFFTFLVLMNTITLSMNKYGQKEEMEIFLEQTNVWFTWLFIYEMFAKILGIGSNKYFADRMNWLDGGIVMISIFEMVSPILMPGGSQNLSGLKTIRTLRTFRVFRVVRLLRSLKSMQTILGVVQRSYKSFIYITALMFLFIFIFTLLGMQTFAGIFKDDVNGTPSNNYDSAAIAFITIFQILTLENWQTVLFVTLRNNNVNKFWVCGIYISWIFIGNFILLNLFLAILLDSFLEEDEEEQDNLVIQERKRIKQLKKMQKKMRKDKNKVHMSTNLIKKMRQAPEASKFYFGEEKGQSEEDLEDLDEDQILAIFKEAGMIKRDKSEIQEQVLFAGVDCEQSFFIFSQTNCFRIFCYRLTKHPFWETIVLTLICFSSIKLATDTYQYSNDPESQTVIISGIIDNAFNWLFIIEMMVKLVSLGLCMDDGSYLRDEWNNLDFFIVSSSIFDMALSDLDIPAIKILRMLRALRPLRFITHNVAMKLIVKALLESLGGIFNVLIVVAVVFLIFAIIGINFFAGKFFYCSLDKYILHNQLTCEYAGGKWQVYDHNFDDVTRGFVTLYATSSLEGWPDTMLQSIDIVGIDKGPLKENTTISLVFFVIFILIGSFFFLNFFIGVLFMKFNAAQRDEEKGFTAKDLGWMDIQRMILTAEPDYETTNVPTQEWRKKFHTLCSSDKFEGFIMSIIMLNIVQMGVYQDGQKEEVTAIIESSNWFFTAIFIGEASLKLVAYGKKYFNNSWNKFDFFVVVSSILDIMLSFMGEGLEFLSIGPQLARVMRVLRVTRILRLAGKAEGLQAILQTIMFSIPALMNVFTLLVLIYFMMSVLGNFLFKNITQGDVIDNEYKNFRNFQNSFLLLFALSTGEDWNRVMFDCSRDKAWGCIENVNCGTSVSYIYFCLLILICSYVMLNLFILVIIQQFEKYYLPEDNMLDRFKNDQISFMKIWKQLTQEKYNCQKIREQYLSKFFRLLGEENEQLGFAIEQYDEGELKKQLLKMGIKSDNGYVYFNELLYRSMRRQYGNMKINKKMQIYELRTQFQIFQKIQSQQNKGGQVNNDQIFNNLVKKENGVNPFLTIMNFKISFRTWLKMSKQVSFRSRSNSQIQKIYYVDVDMETIVQYTSDEELEGSDESSKNFSDDQRYSSNNSMKTKTKDKDKQNQNQKDAHLGKLKRSMLKSIGSRQNSQILLALGKSSGKFRDQAKTDHSMIVDKTQDNMIQTDN